MNKTQAEIETRVKDLPALVAHLVKDPIGSMRRPMRMSWPAAICLQSTSAAVSGIVAALASKSWMDLAVAVIVFPVLTVMVSTVLTLFLYYLFAGFAAVLIDMRRLNSMVVLSTLPFFLAHALSGFLAPLDLVGFAMTTVLLTVGLVDQYGLRRRLVFSLLGAIFIAFFVIWSIAQVLRN